MYAVKFTAWLDPISFHQHVPIKVYTPSSLLLSLNVFGNGRRGNLKFGVKGLRGSGEGGVNVGK